MRYFFKFLYVVCLNEWQHLKGISLAKIREPPISVVLVAKVMSFHHIFKQESLPCQSDTHHECNFTCRKSLLDCVKLLVRSNAKCASSWIQISRLVFCPKPDPKYRGPVYRMQTYRCNAELPVFDLLKCTISYPSSGCLVISFRSVCISCPVLGVCSVLDVYTKIAYSRVWGSFLLRAFGFCHNRVMPGRVAFP